MTMMANRNTAERLKISAVEYAQTLENRKTPADGFTLQTYRMDEMPLVMQLWQQLENRLGGAPLCCSYDWTETWLNHYRDIVNVKFVVGIDHEQVRGICLLTESLHQQIGPSVLSSLHLGTAGEPHGQSVCVEYNELLVEADYRNQFIEHLGILISQEQNWDQFQLDGIPAGQEQSWPVWSEACLRDKRLTVSVRERECRYFDLKSTRESGTDILSTLGKSTKSNLKRRLKQIDDVRVEWAESVEQGLEIFEELVQLHQARWNAVGELGAFASSRFSGFQRELIQRLLPEKRVVLARIQAAGQTIGCLYLLVDGRRLLDYVSGLISFEDFPSPGLISHYLCMEEALQRGFDAYDFLVGDKRHKENLGKASQTLQWVVCERPRWKYRLREVVRTVKQIVRKIVKKS